MPIADGRPFRLPLYSGAEPRYWKGMLLQTDALLARTINISIGLSETGLASAFGVTMRDGIDAVDARVAQFRQVAGKYV